MKKSTLTLTSIYLVVFLIFSAFSTSAVSVGTENKYLFEEIFIERLDIEMGSGEEMIYWYEELFYYSSDNSESTPDYALVKACYPVVSDTLISSEFGEYIIMTGPYSPYKHGYHIYTPSDDKIYTLEEAYHAEIDGIEKALEFLNGTTIAMIGDADANFTLNIKDATWIQKSIAKYSDLPKRHEWNELAFDACDFNRDDKINIKDATAIQKHLAKIDY